MARTIGVSSKVVPGRRFHSDPTQRQIAEFAHKKLLVDARTCIERSKALVKGSRELIHASRELRRQAKRH